MYLKNHLILIILFVLKLALCNEKPVVGILTQEVYWSSFKKFTSSNSTYIAASYVKGVEASGGRVIPVFTNKTTEYYSYVTHINIKCNNHTVSS